MTTIFLRRIIPPSTAGAPSVSDDVWGTIRPARRPTLQTDTSDSLSTHLTRSSFLPQSLCKHWMLYCFKF